MTTLIKVLIAFTLSLFCCSCNITIDGIKGQGDVIKKEKLISKPYSALKSSNGLDVILVKDSSPKIVIEANENLFDYIQVYVENNILYIKSDKNIGRADKKTVLVPYSNLQKITATSGSEIVSKEKVVEKELDIKASSGANINLTIDAENLSTSVSSGGHIRISGKADKHSAKASSGANLKANELLSQDTYAKASSGANIRIYAKNQFEGKASSGAHVIVYGNPTDISKNNSSGGRIRIN